MKGALSDSHAENAGESISGRLEGELLGNRISPTGEYINLGERTMYHVQIDSVILLRSLAARTAICINLRDSASRARSGRRG